MLGKAGLWEENNFLILFALAIFLKLSHNKIMRKILAVVFGILAMVIVVELAVLFPSQTGRDRQSQFYILLPRPAPNQKKFRFLFLLLIKKER